MLNTSLPIILRHIGSAVTGVGFSDFVYKFFLNFFEVLFCGKTCLMINKKGLQIAEGDTFSIWIMILSHPWSFFRSKIWIVWSMPSMEIFSIKMRSWWQLLNIIVLNLLWNLIPKQVWSFKNTVHFACYFELIFWSEASNEACNSSLKFQIDECLKWMLVSLIR